MPQSITLCTALSASARRALRIAGYETTDDLANEHTSEILVISAGYLFSGAELGLPVSECDGILEATQRTKRDIVPSSQPASQLMGAEYRFPCPKYAFMDRLLPGGLSPGQIVEISGPPGTMKDSVGLEYVRSALTFGKEVIIIDLQNMITAGILRNLFQIGYNALIRYLHIGSLPELMVFLRNLPSYVGTNTALLMISSVHFPFQHHTQLRGPKRGALLKVIKHALLPACTRGLAVITTSQMSTKMLDQNGRLANFETGVKSVLVPQLDGGYLPAGCTHRVVLVPNSPRTGHVVARVLSAPTLQPDQKGPEAAYEIVSRRLSHSCEGLGIPPIIATN
ncbi:hypothetical protein CONPUDRAFT_156594 [Coniophora puteana RWD-64-598 SS2]|uniref:DNA recombination and repair protein Rad51-like C-terminal domain-containing protein n=1 Tax=Coniophora puteana (strain RWD-64-598) TaxID=741705 RepID=A0A5M3MHP1_CONPW|nr:uncharacterized protein CONPUDRAFT_156594 [Coniophora puteana RWD-64-598 SS2]EIW78623.1 hypothetical protein CONPUDRAFT_156594 [Coniophora puteana RWD-64-598 SS2]